MDEKLRIFLCEDDENLGMILREYLQAKGFTTDLFTDGEAGLKGFSEAKYDLIAIDISVPDETVAENMCANWHSKSQDIYQYIFKKLMN